MPPIAAKVLMTVGLLSLSLMIGRWATELLWNPLWVASPEVLPFLFDTGVTWLLVAISTWLVWSRAFTFREGRAQRQFLLAVACVLLIAVIALLPKVGTPLDYSDIVYQGYNSVIPIGWFIFACWIAGSTPPGSLGRVRDLSGAVVRCSKCRYDMTGQHSAVCPECGTKHTIGEVWRCGAATGLDAAAMDDDSPARDRPGSP